LRPVPALSGVVDADKNKTEGDVPRAIKLTKQGTMKGKSFGAELRVLSALHTVTSARAIN